MHRLPSLSHLTRHELWLTQPLVYRSALALLFPAERAWAEAVVEATLALDHPAAEMLRMAAMLSAT